MSLLPCPFCGGVNNRIDTSTHWTGLRSVVLSVTVQHWCERGAGELQSTVQIKAKTEADAVALWNTRAGMARKATRPVSLEIPL